MSGKTILILLTVALALSVGLVVLTSHNVGEVSLREGQEAQPTTEVTEEDIHQHIAGNNTFALELYHALEEEGGNLFFSPYSISVCLSMVYCGARGETYKEMGRTLHFSLPPAALSSIVAKLDEELLQENGLSVANSLWAQQGHPFDRSFLALLQEGYGAEPHTVDFAASPESAREEINTWVKRETAERIKNLIPPGGVDSTTSLVLANAIYFRDSWEYRFQSLPQPVEFHLLDGGTVKVPMMSVNASLAWMRQDSFQTLSLPYSGETSMVILLPDQGAFGVFQDSLSQDKLTSILASLEEQTVTLTMPSFEYAAGFQLREALEALGMQVPFSSTANFSGMSKGQLQIDEVFHKAFVHVDEQGTEAAAATATTMSKGLARSTSINIDRPFIFLIRDEASGAILFVGRVLNPQGRE